MSENANANEQGAADPNKGEVTFTAEQQAKIDEIINKRLGDASKKHADEIGNQSNIGFKVRFISF